MKTSISFRLELNDGQVIHLTHDELHELHDKLTILLNDNYENPTKDDSGV